ncbi:MAG: hypothetical protein COB65_09510 [Thalassobium sp.]|nr:MAG: hypothetical protein COB65_09510 [Thalassobium sp.]
MLCAIFWLRYGAAHRASVKRSTRNAHHASAPTCAGIDIGQSEFGAGKAARAPCIVGALMRRPYGSRSASRER